MNIASNWLLMTCCYDYTSVLHSILTWWASFAVDSDHHRLPHAQSANAAECLALIGTGIPYSFLKRLKDHCRKGSRNSVRSRHSRCPQKMQCVQNTVGQLHIWNPADCDRACTVQVQVRPSTSSERRWEHQVLSLTEELWATVSCWEMESQFSLWV